MNRTCLALAGLGLTLALFAAPAPAHAFDPHRLAIQLDNDEFTGNRPDDRWYSSGGRIDWHDAAGTTAPRGAVDCFSPVQTMRQPARQRFHSLGQDIYSQNNRLNSQPDPDDRPVGAYLYLQTGSSLVSPVAAGRSGQATLKWELGVTGPAALGEPVQNGLHKLLDVDRVTLWDYQVRPRLGLNMHFRCVRQYAATDPEVRQPMVLQAGYDLSVGSVLTQAGIVLAVSAGPGARAMAPPTTARLASPVARKLRGWGVIAGLSARAVAYDAMIDGDTYGYRPNVSSKPLQGDVFIGLSVALGSRWQLSYALSRRSMDFEGDEVEARNFRLQTVGQFVLQAPLD